MSPAPGRLESKLLSDVENFRMIAGEHARVCSKVSFDGNRGDNQPANQRARHRIANRNQILRCFEGEPMRPRMKEKPSIPETREPHDNEDSVQEPQRAQKPVWKRQSV